MLAALFNSPHNLRLVDYPLTKLESDQVLVKVGACGICGTDFHIYHGKAPAKAPVIIGHEYAGEIVEKGNDVSNFSVGDKIAVNPNIHCGYCEFCKTGKIHLCRNLKALGVTVNGGFAQYSKVLVTQAYKIPGNYSVKHAAFAEPLSCCLHGIVQANIKIGDSVAIIGAGTIGLFMVQLARLKGSSKIIVFDPVPEKRKLAAELNADYVFDPADDEFISKTKEVTSGGTDIVIECAGNESAAQISLDLVRKGGTIVIFGLSSSDSFLKLNLQTLFHNELTIKSSLLNPYTFQTAVDLLITGRIKVDLFNTHYFSLEDQKLFSVFNNGGDRTISKYMVVPNI
jgi:2-desacetyl-2-hydroxyethyl bacteriochlorophyllide A dehydrogenase